MNARERSFLNGLKDLLKRHEAELTVVDNYPGYAECGQDLQLEVYASSSYVLPSIALELGKAVDTESLQELLDSK